MNKNMQIVYNTYSYSKIFRTVYFEHIIDNYQYQRLQYINTYYIPT